MSHVNGVPDQPLDAEKRYELARYPNVKTISQANLGEFLKALCQKLDADPGVSGTDYEALFCPD